MTSTSTSVLSSSLSAPPPPPPHSSIRAYFHQTLAAAIADGCLNAEDCSKGAEQQNCDDAHPQIFFATHSRLPRCKISERRREIHQEQSAVPQTPCCERSGHTISEIAQMERWYRAVKQRSLGLSGLYWIVAGLTLTEGRATVSSSTSEGDSYFKLRQITRYIVESLCPDSAGFAQGPTLKPHGCIVATLAALQTLLLLNKLHIASDAFGVELVLHDSDLPLLSSPSPLRVATSLGGLEADNAACCVLTRSQKHSLATWVVSLIHDGSGLFRRNKGRCCSHLPDIRFTLAALLCLKYLQSLSLLEDPSRIVDAVLRCWNSTDGGFGFAPGEESHTGFVYCALASLCVLNATLPPKFHAPITNYLRKRVHLKSGFVRCPGKEPDLCYAWWTLASAELLRRLGVDVQPPVCPPSQVESLIHACYRPRDGGYARSPKDCADVFHTFFALATLALLRDQIDPIDALPKPASAES